MTGLQVGYGAVLIVLLGALLLAIVSVLGVGYWSVRLADRLGSGHPLLAGVAGSVACLGSYWLAFRAGGRLPFWMAVGLGTAVVASGLVAGGIGLVRRGLDFVRG